MGLNLLPPLVRETWECHEWRHACAVMVKDFPREWADLVSLLEDFKLTRTALTTPGRGNKSVMAERIDTFLGERGWVETQFDTAIRVDQAERNSPTHKIDCFKNKIALETEWNNKDPFFDRDLNNFRLLFDLRVVSVGIIITRSDTLRAAVPRQVGKFKNGNTTHMSALLPRIEGGGGGGCPILAFGITPDLYRDNE